jgi:hypothetical protein
MSLEAQQVNLPFTAGPDPRPRGWLRRLLGIAAPDQALQRIRNRLAATPAHELSTGDITEELIDCGVKGAEARKVVLGLFGEALAAASGTMTVGADFALTPATPVKVRSRVGTKIPADRASPEEYQEAIRADGSAGRGVRCGCRGDDGKPGAGGGERRIGAQALTPARFHLSTAITFSVAMAPNLERSHGTRRRRPWARRLVRGGTYSEDAGEVAARPAIASRAVPRSPSPPPTS